MERPTTAAVLQVVPPLRLHHLSLSSLEESAPPLLPTSGYSNHAQESSGPAQVAAVPQPHAEALVKALAYYDQVRQPHHQISITRIISIIMFYVLK